jgi:hypothetical protein
VENPDKKLIGRKDQMFHIWLEKPLAIEVAEMAMREAATSGHSTTPTSLAKEILIWALDAYRNVGSLRELKQAVVSAGTEVPQEQKLRFHSSKRIPLVNNIEQRAEQITKLKGKVRGRKRKKDLKSGTDQT